MENTNVARVRRILEKLKQCQTRQLSCYGSDVHHFRLKPPIPEADVQDFESEQGIRLPEDFRTFLTHGGNGGAGPYNGLFPLNEWNDFADWVVDERPANFLALPCLLYQEMPRAEDWEEHLGDTSPYQGTLSLGSRGCAFATQLIVSGPYAGRVVYVDADGNEPPYIVHETDFLSWYERWLDELLQGYESSWFGYGPGGGEEDFWRILDDPQSDDDFKAEAASAFCRLPRLSDDTIGRIPALLESPLAGVRRAAVAIIEKFGIKTLPENVARLLDDSSSDVRQRAVYMAMKLDPQRWSETVRHRLLEDADDNVAQTAFYRLQEAGALLKPDLLHIIKASPRPHLRSSAAGAIVWEEGDAALLVNLLTDQDRNVRFSAIGGLKGVRGRDALPDILELLSRETDTYIVEAILRMLGEFAEPATVPVLLERAQSAEDFHRLAAIEALVNIGDERAVAIVRVMLQEQRPPVRRDIYGFTSQTHIRTIAELVRTTLEDAANPTLREKVLSAT